VLDSVFQGLVFDDFRESILGDTFSILQPGHLDWQMPKSNLCSMPGSFIQSMTALLRRPTNLAQASLTDAAGSEGEGVLEDDVGVGSLVTIILPRRMGRWVVSVYCSHSFGQLWGLKTASCMYRC
jgi:hypothetical protein